MKKMQFTNNNMGWRNKHPTWEQLETCRRLEIHPLPTTRGEASDLITKSLEEKEYSEYDEVGGFNYPDKEY